MVLNCLVKKKLSTSQNWKKIAEFVIRKKYIKHWNDKKRTRLHNQICQFWIQTELILSKKKKGFTLKQINWLQDSNTRRPILHIQICYHNEIILTAVVSFHLCIDFTRVKACLHSLFSCLAINKTTGCTVWQVPAWCKVCLFPNCRLNFITLKCIVNYYESLFIMKLLGL